MDKILKQEEIDALFGAARASGPVGGEAPLRVTPYNFSSAGQISNEQLRAISMLNDLFARNLTHNLAASLRSKFQVNLVSAEQIPFHEFLLRIAEISYVASVRLQPLGAVSVLHLEMSLVPPIIDLLLGGEGKGLHEQVRKHCDVLVRIPMAGKISSLNVSVAAGIVLFEWKRRRRSQ